MRRYAATDIFARVLRQVSVHAVVVAITIVLWLNNRSLLLSKLLVADLRERKLAV